MIHESRFRSHDDLDLFERRWIPQGTPVANLILLHGYAEHSGRYDHVAEVLNAIGCTVCAYDQRGHGRSEGRRGYINAFEDLITDLDAYVGHLRPHLDDKPLFMMGHSMGGLVLVHYVQTYDVRVRGLVFSSPFLAIPPDVSRLLVALADVLGALTPWLPVASLDTQAVARDPAVVRAYETDPLNYHGRVRSRTGAQLNGAIAQARARFDRVTAPVYIVHGAEDRLVPAEGSRLLYERCRSDDKTLKVYEGGYHELLNDFGKEGVLKDLCAWLAARSSPGSKSSTPP